MPLSENEQRLLEQMEAALAAEDPKLASTLRGTTTRRLHRRRAALAGLGFLVGIAALVGGLEFSPVLSVAGFVIMLVSTVVALRSWEQVDGNQPSVVQPSARPRGSSAERDFMNKMEERWRRRNEGDE